MTDLSTIELRPAAPGDARLLFEWVNRADSLVRKLHTNAPIGWDEHTTWFEERLGDKACAIWIAERGGEPVGQIRMTGETGGFAVDIYVIAAARRQGLARTMLARACAMAGERWPGRATIARVRRDNPGSLHLFATAGFIETGQCADFVTLTCEAS